MLLKGHPGGILAAFHSRAQARFRDFHATVTKKRVLNFVTKTFVHVKISTGLFYLFGVEETKKSWIIKGYDAQSPSDEDDDDEVIRYEFSFEATADFIPAGGVQVENEHHREMFLKDMVLDGLPAGPVN